MYLLDTNLIIRYLTEDDKKKATAVEELLKKPESKLYLVDVAIAEIIWVLKSVYGENREEVVKKLRILLSSTTIKYNKEVITQTLKNYEEKNIGWVDAYLAALIQVGKYKALYSYDKGLDKIPGIRRIEPK